MGHSDYVYEDGTDWLVRETWHVTTTGPVYDLARYAYVDGQLARVEYLKNNDPAQGYATAQVQFNWHGGAVMAIGPNGYGYTKPQTRIGPATFDPWGATAYGDDPPPWPNYGWNAAWGYLWFSDLGLYYVHGRWYSPDLGRFLSPNEKGDYMYGGDGPCVEDAVNCAWLQLQSVRTDAIEFTGGAAGQFLWDQLYGTPEEFGLFLREDTEAIIAGRTAGRSASEALNLYLIAQGLGEIGAGFGIGGASLACVPATAGACTVPAAVGGATALRLVLKGTIEAGWGCTHLAYQQTHPLQFAKASGSQASSDVLARNMEKKGIRRPSDTAAHHIVAGSDPRAAQSRNILKQAKIDINDADNGVFLPRNRNVPNPLAQEIHSTLHTDAYHRRVFLELMKAGQDSAGIRAVLRQIAAELQAAIFPY